MPTFWPLAAAEPLAAALLEAPWEEAAEVAELEELEELEEHAASAAVAQRAAAA